jgi:hypothetical protein
VAGRAVIGDDPIYGQRAFALREPVELVAFAGLGQVTPVVAQGFMHATPAANIIAGVCQVTPVVAQGFMRLRAAGHRAMRRAGIAQPWRAALGGSSLARSSRSSRPSPATATSRSTRC